MFVAGNISLASAQNNGGVYEAPFDTPSGSFEWDVITEESADRPDIIEEGGVATLSLEFELNPNDGPPFPLVTSTNNIYAGGTFLDYTTTLTELDDSGQHTTVVLQLASIGDQFSDFELNGQAPTEFFNRGFVPDLVHGFSGSQFDTTFYWVEWQLEGEGRDSFELTFSTTPHISLGGFRIDYVTSDSLVDATAASVLTLPGDFDLDGDVDVDDLNQYIGQLGTDTNGMQDRLDLNADGIIDTEDFEEHYSQRIQIPGLGQGTLQGDINLDGSVDVLNDALRLVSTLGGFVSSWTDGDVTGDGQVDVLNDALALVVNLGADRVNP